jgi:hypothetical protein
MFLRWFIPPSIHPQIRIITAPDRIASAPGKMARTRAPVEHDVSDSQGEQILVCFATAHIPQSYP